MNKASLVFALLPFTFALAADGQERQVPTKHIEKKDIPLDDLAHTFFVLQTAPDALAEIISHAGLERIKPELAAHKRDIQDQGRRAAKMRKMCRDLQHAPTATQFAAVLSKSEQEEREEMRKSARRILSVLDPQDREAVENFLDSQFRQGVSRSAMDWTALFASPTEPFPSDHTNAITQRTCDIATKAERNRGQAIAPS